jgi:uncharacterized protein (DUF4415 family)
MKKRPDPELIDDDAPEWTDEVAARAVSLAGLPAGLRTKLRGRPKLANAKVAISLRVDPSVLARWKASGTGWQTRMAQALAARAPRL